MIEVKINGGSWTELEQQIAGMIREGQQSGGANPALEKENRKLWDNLSNAQSIIDEMEKELEASRQRIAELEKALDCIEANPTPAAATPASEQTATVTDTESDPATGLSTTSKAEQPTYKMEGVRAFLASAREAGVDITRVLKPFGGRLPAVKEEDYPALMEAAKAALAELKEKK